MKQKRKKSKVVPVELDDFDREFSKLVSINATKSLLNFPCSKCQVVGYGLCRECETSKLKWIKDKGTTSL